MNDWKNDFNDFKKLTLITLKNIRDKSDCHSEFEAALFELVVSLVSLNSFTVENKQEYYNCLKESVSNSHVLFEMSRKN